MGLVGKKNSSQCTEGKSFVSSVVQDEGSSWYGSLPTINVNLSKYRDFSGGPSPCMYNTSHFKLFLLLFWHGWCITTTKAWTKAVAGWLRVCLHWDYTALHWEWIQVPWESPRHGGAHDFVTSVQGLYRIMTYWLTSITPQCSMCFYEWFHHHHHSCESVLFSSAFS